MRAVANDARPLVVDARQMPRAAADVTADNQLIGVTCHAHARPGDRVSAAGHWKFRNRKAQCEELVELLDKLQVILTSISGKLSSGSSFMPMTFTLYFEHKVVFFRCCFAEADANRVRRRLRHNHRLPLLTAADRAPAASVDDRPNRQRHNKLRYYVLIQGV